MRVEQVAITKLRPDKGNPRTMKRHDAEALKRSLEEFGAVEPAVVNKDGRIIGGHQRISAAAELGWERFPVIYVDLPKEKARLLNLALNRIDGEWDQEKLGQMLAELAGSDADLLLSGFDQREAEKLIAAVGQEEEVSHTPQKPSEPVTRTGDLIRLGDHRLLCGDATNAADVARVLDGAKPKLCATDPPYGVELEPAWREDTPLNRRGAARRGDLENDDRVDWSAAFALFPGNVLYAWFASQNIVAATVAVEAAGFIPRQTIIWVKTNAPIGRSAYHWRHEPCWYAVRKGKRPPWHGGRDQTTVWESASPIVSRGDTDDMKTSHPTQKPLALWEIPIRNHLRRGEHVYDPFAGSGTCLIAAERLKRKALCLELDPAYCDVIVARWEQHTGRKARRPRRS